MLRSSIKITTIIIENYLSELKSEIEQIQFKANKLLDKQRLIHYNVLNTRREEIESNTLQTKQSNETIKKTNLLLLRVSQIHQDIIAWSGILNFVLQQPISNPNEMSVTLTESKVPKGVENLMLNELLELCEQEEEYVFCSLVKTKISSFAA